MYNILIIDDEKEVCRSLKGILEDEGYVAEMASCLEEAWELIKRSTPHLILLDVWWGKQGIWDGLSALEKIKQAYPLIPVIMMSGHATLSVAVKALQKGAHDFLEKPLTIERLITTISHALELSNLRSNQRQSKQKSLDIFWPVELEKSLKKIALSDAAITLISPPGSGEERLARTIWTQSPRSHASFTILNANEIAAFSSEQWYGQEEEGMVKSLGFLEEIQGGTLMLRHAHQLDENWQNYWAKFLEIAKHKRCNGKDFVSLDIRLIFSLSPEFAHETFFSNQRFFHRLMANTWSIPLIHPQHSIFFGWIDLFLKQLSKDYGFNRIELDESALQILRQHAWSGQLEELKSTLNLAFIYALQEQKNQFDVLDKSRHSSFFERHLTILDRHLPKAPLVEKNFEEWEKIFTLPFKEAKARFEWRYMKSQLSKIDGNITKAAQSIGMNRTAFHRKIKMLEKMTIPSP